MSPGRRAGDRPPDELRWLVALGLVLVVLVALIVWKLASP